MICNRCDLDKERIFSHTTKDGRNTKKYKGIDGTLWNGRTCSDCQKKVMKNRNKRRPPKNKIHQYINGESYASINV